jgi:predicted nucleic acid-binding protein
LNGTVGIRGISMRIYLDVCAIQRPFDDAGQQRILDETEVLRAVVKLIERGSIELVGSFALDYENHLNPDPTRREYTEMVLSLASERIKPSAAVERRTNAFKAVGMGTWDAAHLAAAVEAGVNFFCTCDDRLLRLARKADTGLTRAVSLLELFKEVEK